MVKFLGMENGWSHLPPSLIMLQTFRWKVGTLVMKQLLERDKHKAHNHIPKCLILWTAVGLTRTHFVSPVGRFVCILRYMVRRIPDEMHPLEGLLATFFYLPVKSTSVQTFFLFCGKKIFQLS